MRHTCREGERAQEIKTHDGQVAYALYRRWMEGQGKRAPPIETFAISTYYSSFLKFAKWVKETGIPDATRYVDLMVDKKIAPALWRRDEAYAMFLEWVDNKSSPIEQAEITIETLATLGESLGIPLGEVWDHMQPGAVLELIQQRRLSPWLLFCSKTFKGWIETLHEADRHALMRGIGIGYWAVKLENAGDVVRDLKEVADQLGI